MHSRSCLPTGPAWMPPSSSTCLHSPRLLHVAPSPSKFPSSPNSHSQLRDVMPGFQRKSKQPEVNSPSCGPQVCLRLCPRVVCDSLQAPCTPSCLFSLSPPPPFSFSIFGEILNGSCLMMPHLCPGEIFLCYFSLFIVFNCLLYTDSFFVCLFFNLCRLLAVACRIFSCTRELLVVACGI